MFLDPGRTTGFAVAYPGLRHESWQARGTQTWHSIERHCASGGKAAIGWERFDITPFTHRLDGSLDAIEVIGVARYVAHTNGCHVLPASSRDARKIASDTVLKVVGWYLPGNDHANDASRHLFSYLSRERLLTAEIRDRITSYLEGKTER